MVTTEDNRKGSNPSFDEVDIDKLAKQQLVIETITKHTGSSSPHKIFQQIHCAVSTGSKLSCKILSGGYTNYSYQVLVEDHPDLCLFAKLSFEYALWNPDKSSHYSLKRTDNEWEIMTTVSKIAPDCVVKPLGCWDLVQDGQGMKLLVTEWSNADEQFCNQFIDGSVDLRIATKIAETLAALHNIKDFDPEFNANVKPCMENMLEQMKVFVHAACAKENPKDRTEAYCVDVGADILGKVVDGIISNYHKRDCLIHSDSHVMNILVEPKPSVEHLELFGPNGTMVLCDWEMAMAGPQGRDVGLALAFPVACYVAHALNGIVVESIPEYITILTESYLGNVTEAGMKCNKKAALYRNIIGWSGWFQFVAYHVLRIGHSFPVQNQESNEYVQDTMGILGLKMMRFSLDNNHTSESLGIDELQSIFEDMLQEEVLNAYRVFADQRRKSKHIMQPRKSSLLRAANRRISDARMNFVSMDSYLEELD